MDHPLVPLCSIVSMAIDSQCKWLRILELPYHISSHICGEIPPGRPYIGLMYGRYLQSKFLSHGRFPVRYASHYQRSPPEGAPVANLVSAYDKLSWIYDECIHTSVGLNTMMGNFLGDRSMLRNINGDYANVIGLATLRATFTHASSLSI